MNKPVNFLMVVMDFYQAGAPRFAYEMDKALNKSTFKTSVLSVRNLKANSLFSDYYYPKHKELRSDIFFADDILKKRSRFDSFVKKAFLNSISLKILSTSLKNKISFYLQHNNKKKERLSFFLNQFDVISWVGEYTFGEFLKYMDAMVFNKSIIHLMGVKFQNVIDFNHYPKDKHYIITSGLTEDDEIKYELSELKSFSNIYFPLTIEINQKINTWNFRKNKQKNRIGIFTRLDNTKPLDIFFSAFHLLLDKLPDSELHIFGTGNPIQTGMKRLADNFKITSKVFFRGHQQDIMKTAVDEDLDLIWFHGYKNRPAGYAGFDICAAGIPQIFWDFSNTEENLNSDSAPYPHFRNLNQFVSKSVCLLTYKEEAMKLSDKQFNDLIQHRDIRAQIKTLEEVFLKVVAKQNLKN